MMDIKMNNNSFQSIRSNYTSPTTSSGTGHKSPLERQDYRQQPYQCPKRLNKSREKLTSHISAELSPPSRRCPYPPAHPPLKLVILNEICPKNGFSCQCFQGGFCEHGSFVASGQEVATRIVRRTMGRDGEHATTLNSGKCGNIEEEEQQSRRTCPTQQNLQQQQQQHHPDDEKEQQEPQRLAKYRLSNSNWNSSSSSSRASPSLNSGCYNISNTTTNNSIISHKQEEDEAVDFHKTTSAASREPANCWIWWCWSNRLSNLPLRTLGCGQQVGHITTTEGGTTTSSSLSLHSTKLYPAKQQQHGQSNKSLKCKTKSPSSTSASSTWPKCFSSSSSSSSSLSSITQAMAGIYNNIIRHFGLQLCCLLLLRLTMITSAVAVGMDAANANLTDLGSPAPKYQTAYACEGKKLTIECDPGDVINLIRANYGRFSITICNDHGNMEWSVNCMFPKSLTVLNSRCAHKQSCGVLATTSMFGDPCPGTHKYLEAHYQCISASQTSTTTNRPSPPPWVLSNAPPILPNGSSSIINPGLVQPPLPPAQLPPRMPPMPGLPVSAVPSSPGPPTIHTTLPGGRLKANSSIKPPTRHDGLPPPPPLHHHHHTNGNHHTAAKTDQQKDILPRDHPHKAPTQETKTVKSQSGGVSNTTTPPNTRILTGVGGTGSDDGTLLTTKTTTRQQQLPNPLPSGTTTVSSLGNINSTLGSGIIKSINNINLNTGLVGEDETNMFCGPTHARNLFWNITRVGDVNVQPCPGGATGIAKWRCVLMKRMSLDEDEDIPSSTPNALCNGTTCTSFRLRNFEPTWHPLTPDLTQCRSLWLSNLEVRVSQRDSSLISIANDLSEVTSSKTLYGGDMLVTTKIIQTMSEKMFHDKETFPDQRLREAMILELLQGVVKTGSNLLDESQLSSWLDLNQEDQMRVATSLLTGLEENAFLLADTIIRERNVVQKVKNILLSVRVLETKNMQSNEVFPDNGQWQISDDRIELPKAALIENSDGGLVRIVFAAFDRLESILKPSYDHFDIKSARSYIRSTAILTNDTADSSNSSPSPQRIRILNSKVISASLGKGRHIQLSQPIKLTLRHLKTENVTNPTCVFWNYIDHAWSANGCVLESTNRTHSICMCNHLTNFAILMDVMDSHTHSLFTMFDGNMRILIYVSISICLIFIVVALLTLKIFNGVFIKVRSSTSSSCQGGQQQLSHSRRGGGSSRSRQNNIIDQTHESIQITNPTQVATTSNNIQNLQQQLNLQHMQNISPSNVTANNFIHHNSIRNSNRNNLNANNFNLQQQQQQQVVAAAAAVVVSNNNQRNLQMNNLNLNLNLQAHPHHNHGHNLNHNHVTTAAQQHMETSMSNTAVAAAAIAAALQQHHVNTNAAVAAAAATTTPSSNNLNVNRNNHNNANNSNRINNPDPNNIIMQGNMDDLQYKWWWW